MTVLMYGLDHPQAPGQFAPKQLFGVGGVTVALASWLMAASTLSDICAEPVFTSMTPSGPDRHGDVGPVGDQHVDVALHRQDVHLAVPGTLVGDSLVDRRSPNVTTGRCRAVELRADPFSVDRYSG